MESVCLSVLFVSVVGVIVLSVFMESVFLSAGRSLLSVCGVSQSLYAVGLCLVCLHRARLSVGRPGCVLSVNLCHRPAGLQGSCLLLCLLVSLCCLQLVSSSCFQRLAVQSLREL